MIGRMAFYGVRAASRNGQQQGPPRQFGIFGKTFWWLVLISVYVHWWRGALCITAAFVIVLTPFVLVHMGSAKGKSAPRESKPDPLAKIMKDWADKP